jgi:hypothetical protein
MSNYKFFLLIVIRQFRTFCEQVYLSTGIKLLIHLALVIFILAIIFSSQILDLLFSIFMATPPSDIPSPEVVKESLVTSKPSLPDSEVIITDKMDESGLYYGYTKTEWFVIGSSVLLLALLLLCVIAGGTPPTIDIGGTPPPPPGSDVIAPLIPSPGSDVIAPLLPSPGDVDFIGPLLPPADGIAPLLKPPGGSESPFFFKQPPKD